MGSHPCILLTFLSLSSCRQTPRTVGWEPFCLRRWRGSTAPYCTLAGSLLSGRWITVQWKRRASPYGGRSVPSATTSWGAHSPSDRTMPRCSGSTAWKMPTRGSLAGVWRYSLSGLRWYIGRVTAWLWLILSPVWRGGGVGLRPAGSRPKLGGGGRRLLEEREEWLSGCSDSRRIR